MSRLVGFLAVLGLSAAVAPQDGGGPCGANEPTLYLESAGASGGALVKRYAWGNTRELEVTARLRTAFGEPEGGVQAYSISVEHTIPCQVIEVTDGLNAITSRGFVKTEIVKGPRLGFVSVAVAGDASLPPVGDFPLVHVKYEVQFGAETLPFLEHEGIIEYRDGLQGSGEPVANLLRVGGLFLAPCLEPLAVTIRVQNFEFMRGDANLDGVLDISDPVKLLRSLFGGDAFLRCDDAGDANDDGRLDISDAVHVLGYLFGRGPPPDQPFPRTGWDLSWDELGCFLDASGA